MKITRETLQQIIKEEVAKARTYLDNLKDKYYDEIKLRPGVTQEQQKAMDFFNRYNKQQENIKQSQETFRQRTNELFNTDFKGFDFNVGEKRFRYGVNNSSEVAESQSDLTTFFKKFLTDGQFFSYSSAEPQASTL